MNFQNKTIVVSGGTKGLGRHLVQNLLEQGANVTIGGRDKSLISGILENEVGQNGCPYFVHTSLENVDDCRNLIAKTIDKFGRVDGLVLYGGITSISDLTDCDYNTYNRIMDINLRSAFFLIQAAIRDMIKNKGGSIVVIGSSHAWSGEKDRAAYAISKGALYTLSEHIAHNYASDNIRCNYFTMGWTPTEGELKLRNQNGMSLKELKQLASKNIPMNRMLKYDDMVPGILYLLSDDSRMVTGSNIRATGGQYI